MKRKNQKDKDFGYKQEILCQRYQSVRNLAFAWNVPLDDIEDVVQEIFIIAYTHLYQLRDPACMNSWLYKLACRHIKGTLKKQSQKDDIEISYDENSWVLEQVDAKRGLTAADRYLTDQELVEMIDRLKQPAPVILRLRFGMGFSLIEIADMLDMNYNTVKTIENRAFKKLKTMIERREVDRGERCARLG